MKAMILAAGEGTRLRPFTLSLPKPAIPFLGVPLIEYGIGLLDELGPCGLVVNHHHLSNEVQKLFKAPNLALRTVEFSDETAQLLGSGGGVHKARPFLQNESCFLVMNGDEVILPWTPGQIQKAHEDHVKSGRLATILVIDHPEVGEKFGGVWCDSANQVRQFSKTAIEGLKGWHYIGIIFLSNRLFNYFKPQVVDENLLYETLTLAMSKGEEVRVFPIKAEWFETGNPADFIAATEFCLDELLMEPPKPWAADLKKFLAKTPPREPLIEAEERMLVSKLENLQRQLKLR